MRLDSQSQWIAKRTNPLLSFDTRYDQKRFRFKSGRPWRTEDAVTSLYRIEGADPRETLGSPEFDLLMQVRGNLRALVLYALLLAVLFASPLILQAWLNPNLPLCSKIVSSAVAFAFGVCIGLVGVFGLQRFP